MRSFNILTVALACVAIFGSSPGFSSNEVCLEFKSILLGERFTAKVPLYDTKVEINGISELERDREEVRQGATLQVLKVECEGNVLEVKIKDVDVWKADGVKIYFRFPAKAGRLDDPVGDLRTMMGFVFEIPSESLGVAEKEPPTVIE